MTTTINAATSTGLAISGDGSGVLKVQSNGVTTNALAWVNFNGVTTTSIRSSYNVSSVTRSSTGVYVINFTTATTDANYSAIGMSNRTTSATDAASAGYGLWTSVYSFSTSSFGLTYNASGSSTLDAALVTAIVFGN